MYYYWRRIGSYIIDLSIISMFSQVIFGLLPGVQLTGSDLLTDILIIYGFLAVSILIAVSYNVLAYRFFNYPLGKLLLSIKVLDEDGNRVSTRLYAKRELNKYVYMYATLGLYIPYQFIKYIWPKKQTFHDRLVNTHIYA